MKTWNVWRDGRCIGTVNAYTRRSAVIMAKKQFGSRIEVEEAVN